MNRAIWAAVAMVVVAVTAAPRGARAQSFDLDFNVDLGGSGSPYFDTPFYDPKDMARGVYDEFRPVEDDEADGLAPRVGRVQTPEPAAQEEWLEGIWELISEDDIGR